MTDIDDLLARLEAEGCDRGRYDREAAAVIRALRAEIEKPAALLTSTDVSRIIEARVRLAP